MGKKGNKVLDREINHKPTKGTQFYGDFVSILTPVLTFPKLLREQGSDCSGYFLPQVGEWKCCILSKEHSQVPGLGPESCMTKILVPWSIVLVQQTQLDVGDGVKPKL